MDYKYYITIIFFILSIQSLLAQNKTSTAKNHESTSTASTNTVMATTTAVATTTNTAGQTTSMTHITTTDVETTTTAATAPVTTVADTTTTVAEIITTTTIAPTTTLTTTAESTSTATETSTVSKGTNVSMTTSTDESTIPLSGNCISFNGSCVWGTDNITECDPCFWHLSSCNSSLGQLCLSDSQCNAKCDCPLSHQKLFNETCIDACQFYSPCQNNSTCTPFANRFDYQCTNCPPFFEGKNCSEDINECLQENPCNMSGIYECMNIEAGFNCTCPQGYIEYRNDPHIQPTCTKVSSIIYFMIEFERSYEQVFKNISSGSRQKLDDGLNKTFHSLFSPTEFISVNIDSISEGSTIIDAHINFLQYQNVSVVDQILQQLINSCNGSRTNPCFDFSDILSWNIDYDRSVDQRCLSVNCPSMTECSLNDTNTALISCRCTAGYSSIGRVIEPDRVIEQCEDVDECLLSSVCNENEQCINAIGSFNCECPYSKSNGLCIRPCQEDVCGSNGNCQQLTESSYRCSCKWTHSGYSCNNPLPLILLITTIIVLILLIAISLLAFNLYRYAQKDKLHVNDFVPLVGQAAPWQT